MNQGLSKAGAGPSQEKVPGGQPGHPPRNGRPSRHVCGPVGGAPRSHAGVRAKAEGLLRGRQGSLETRVGGASRVPTGPGHDVHSRACCPLTTTPDPDIHQRQLAQCLQSHFLLIVTYLQ